MADTIRDRMIHAWNTFTSGAQASYYSRYPEEGMSYGRRPDRVRLSAGNEKSIVSSVYNKMAVDVASMTIVHARTDENGKYLETINSGLNDCLSIEANVDQTGRNLIQDVVLSMFDEGSVAVVPVDTTLNPNTGSYDILSLRTGKIIEWYPHFVKVSLYNENTGKREDVTLPKKQVAIIENPFYSVMNEPNSTAKRLIYKLNLLDAVDEQSSSGKLDLIIQLPYVIKSKARREQAEERRKEIEVQMAGSKYGIAYTDGTEKITQLNRPVENNLMGQIEFLTELLFNQLGMSDKIFKGTANEEEQNSYYNSTLEPVVSAITLEFKRKFLTKTARTQRQSIMHFRDPFKLVPVKTLADVADKFTRNEILSSNEIRTMVGFKPSKQEGADDLRNKNLNPKKLDDVDNKPAVEDREPTTVDKTREKEHSNEV